MFSLYTNIFCNQNKYIYTWEYFWEKTNLIISKKSLFPGLDIHLKVQTATFSFLPNIFYLKKRDTYPNSYSRAFICKKKLYRRKLSIETGNKSVLDKTMDNESNKINSTTCRIKVSLSNRLIDHIAKYRHSSEGKDTSDLLSSTSWNSSSKGIANVFLSTPLPLSLCLTLLFKYSLWFFFFTVSGFLSILPSILVRK